MLNYFKAELYRYAHKKSTYIYYAVIIAILIAGFTWVANSNGGIKSPTMLNVGVSLNYFLPLMIGVPIFLTVYNDDLNAKNMGNIISTKTSRLSILVTKFIVSVIALLIGFALMAILFFASYFIMFKSFGDISSEQLNMIVNSATIRFISIVGFLSIANVITFVFQKSSFSLIFFLTLILGFFNSLLGVLTMLNASLDVISENSLSFLTSKALDVVAAGNGIPSYFYTAALAYIVISLIVTVILFQRRDIEVN